MNGFKDELTNNILAFWMANMQDEEHGGFYGQIDGYDILHPQANKGVILHTRILWTFSAAYRILKDKQYLAMAERAYEYLKKYFMDKESGGVYWELDYKGNPVNTKKQTYAQGFALYGLSEYYRATKDKEALQMAIKLFYLIEENKDKTHGGYFEAFTREWKSIEDMRLSEKDANEKKSMNTHLHILEPYTNLLRIWKAPELVEAQRDLILIFRDRILDGKTQHQHLFFEEDWTVKSSAISFGHDIEAAWLLFEAAEILGNKALLKEIKKLSVKISDASAKGIMTDGSMLYEKKGKYTDLERHWWVQAEAVVGFMFTYKNTADLKYREKASGAWQYIRDQIIDKANGEWVWSRLSDGSINRKNDKAGFWKCPYHNARMCMEMISNFGLS